jgi:hypothetical protein
MLSSQVTPLIVLRLCLEDESPLTFRFVRKRLLPSSRLIFIGLRVRVAGHLERQRSARCEARRAGE